MQRQFFPDARRAGIGLLVLFVAVDYLLVTLAILLFASGVLAPITEATGGLITRGLLVNLPIILVGVVAVMLWLGKLRAGDVGLVWSKLLAGVVFTVGLWVLVQIVELALGWAVNGTVDFAPQWSQVAITVPIGGFLGQLFGNSLYEDIAYRGFLLPQVLARLGDRWPKRPVLGLAVALVATQGLFALRHIPGDILGGYGPADIALDLLRLAAIGIVYGLLYLRTRNLFLVIGIHAMGDAPISLFAATFDPSLLAPLFALLTLLVWPLFSRKETTRPQVGTTLSAQHP